MTVHFSVESFFGIGRRFLIRRFKAINLQYLETV